MAPWQLEAEAPHISEVQEAEKGRQTLVRLSPSPSTNLSPQT